MSLFSRRNRNAEAGYSVVDEHLTVRGELDTEGTVRVDGRVDGSLHRIGILIVGPAGTVVGDVEAREVVVAGTILGSVRAGKRIEVQSKAKVHGDVAAGAMQLHEGGAVLGHISVAAEHIEKLAAAEPGQAPRAAALVAS